MLTPSVRTCISGIRRVFTCTRLTRLGGAAHYLVTLSGGHVITEDGVLSMAGTEKMVLICLDDIGVRVVDSVPSTVL